MEKQQTCPLRNQQQLQKYKTNSDWHHPKMWFQLECHYYLSVSGLQQAWELCPLLFHTPPLDLQQQREEVLIIHGARSSATLILQPALGLKVRGVQWNQFIVRFSLSIIWKPWVEHWLTCVVRIMLYRSSLGAGAALGSGAGAGVGLLTKVSCLMLPLRLLVLDLGCEESSALWSSSRRAWAVATNSKNSSVCSEVMEEKTTGGRSGDAIQVSQSVSQSEVS